MTNPSERREQSIMAIMEALRPLLTESGIVGVAVTGIVRIEKNAVSPFGLTMGVGPEAVEIVSELTAAFAGGEMERVEERRLLLDIPKKN